MTERPAETIRGPVQSAISQLLQNFETAMWARGVSAQTSNEVLNLVTFGDHRGGGQDDVIRDVPEWAEDVAGGMLRLIGRSLSGPRVASAGGPPPGSPPTDEDLRMVVLALVRLVLKTAPDTFDQVLAP